jgi:hypothetical protein
MPAGISKAKGRRNSKTMRSANSRAKLNLPAKAGKRRPHNIVKKGDDYIAAAFNPRPKVEKDEKRMFIMDYTVHENPHGKVDYNSLGKGVKR